MASSPEHDEGYDMDLCMMVQGYGFEEGAGIGWDFDVRTENARHWRGRSGPPF